MSKIIYSGLHVGEESEMGFPGIEDEDECKESGIVLSYGVQIFPQYRGQHIGTHAHKERLDRWIKDGYNYALCTVRRDNVPQLRILANNGWVRLANTASNRGTPIYIMGRTLK